MVVTFDGGHQTLPITLHLRRKSPLWGMESLWRLPPNQHSHRRRQVPREDTYRLQCQLVRKNNLLQGGPLKGVPSNSCCTRGYWQNSRDNAIWAVHFPTLPLWTKKRRTRFPAYDGRNLGRYTLLFRLFRRHPRLLQQPTGAPRASPQYLPNIGSQRPRCQSGQVHPGRQQTRLPGIPCDTRRHCTPPRKS